MGSNPLKCGKVSTLKRGKGVPTSHFFHRQNSHRHRNSQRAAARQRRHAPKPVNSINPTRASLHLANRRRARCRSISIPWLSNLHPISIEFPSNSIELTAIMSIISYLWRWWTDDRLRQSAKTSPEIRSIGKSIRRDSSLMGRTVSLAVSRSRWHRLAVDGAVLTAGRRAIQPCGRSFAYCFHSPSVTVATRGPFSEFNFNFQEMKMPNYCRLKERDLMQIGHLICIQLSIFLGNGPNFLSI